VADNYIVHCRNNNGDVEFYNPGTGTVMFAFRVSASGMPVESAVDGLTAHAGGGQTNATPLTAQNNRVSTVATNGDSSVLPASVAGLTLQVSNAGTGSMNVYPAVGESINALAVNAAFAVASGKTASFTCYAAGLWHSILSA
jgi:hypothetical protein